MNDFPEKVYILGAGFSKCAGLPVQRDFQTLLLSASFATPIDLVISERIRSFFQTAFSWHDGAPMPSMEDIFTCIDLSAGSGHHLGPRFGPKQLRAIRRMLIYRIFQVLDHRYTRSADIARLLGGDPLKSGFVVSNWDVVLEKHLSDIQRRPGEEPLGINYATEHRLWHGGPRSNRSVRVAKVHGSSNWIYCDNCRVLYVDPFSKLSLTVRAGLIESDFQLFAPQTPSGLLGLNGDNCPECQSHLGPHIATFSFKKSFRSYAFLNSWQHAEQLLTAATSWTFIGYSMPAADFEFKHLMKTCELRSGAKKLEAVVLHDEAARDRFVGFFGQRVDVTMEGLAGYLPKERDITVRQVWAD